MYAFIFSVVQYYIASILQVYSTAGALLLLLGAPVNILPALHLIMEITWKCMHIQVAWRGVDVCDTISIDVHGGINVLSCAGPSCQVLS